MSERASEPSSTNARDPVEAYFAAINADRFDDLRSVFADDVEIHTVGAKPVVGVDAALAHFPAVLAPFATHDDHVTRWIEARHDDGADTVVCEIAYTGELRDGRPVRFDALDVFDLRDGRIVRIGTWYDTRDVIRQVRG